MGGAGEEETGRGRERQRQRQRPKRNEPFGKAGILAFLVSEGPPQKVPVPYPHRPSQGLAGTCWHLGSF